MYITVLLGNIHQSYWIAVQENEDLQELLADNTYVAGESTAYPKAGEIAIVKNIVVTNVGVGNGTQHANVYEV